MNAPHGRRHLDRLRNVPLPALLRAAGAEPDLRDKARWHTRQGVISVSGCKFFNWNRGCGGGGAIDLAIHIFDMHFSEAINWLDAHFPGLATVPSSPSPSETKLRLPVTCPDKLPRVTRYLLAQRRLPSEPVLRLIRSADLYADGYANAVFLLKATNHSPVGAELRGTGSQPWRGMAPGSSRNRGFFSVRPPRIERIILCESAIDAISCLALHPGSWCISTAGARAHAPWLPALLHRPVPIYCGYDADHTGDHLASNMIRTHPCLKRLRPPRHDWNLVLQAHR